MSTLRDVIEQLSPDLQDELQDFAEFLLSKQEAQPRRAPGFRWAGALSHLADRYTSVELQHEIARLRQPHVPR